MIQRYTQKLQEVFIPLDVIFSILSMQVNESKAFIAILIITKIRGSAEQCSLKLHGQQQNRITVAKWSASVHHSGRFSNATNTAPGDGCTRRAPCGSLQKLTGQVHQGRFLDRSAPNLGHLTIVLKLFGWLGAA
jgi:hypothetical protein